MATIKRYTEGPEFTFSLEEFHSFFGLQIARGVYGKQHSVKFLWGDTYGADIFRKSMSRNQFEKFKRHIRFDDKTRRRARKSSDPFACIRTVFEAFTENCRKL
jgi:hypothetical protein